jgi:hypothetical protein
MWEASAIKSPETKELLGARGLAVSTCDGFMVVSPERIVLLPSTMAGKRTYEPILEGMSSLTLWDVA